MSITLWSNNPGTTFHHGNLPTGQVAANAGGWFAVPDNATALAMVAAGSALELHGVPLLSPGVQAGIVGAILLTTIAGPAGLGRALER